MLGRPRVLAFCRAYLMRDFREMFAPLESGFDIHYLTDARCPGSNDTRADFYRAYHANESCVTLSQAQIEDIVGRCRMLSKIDGEEAKRRVNAIGIALEKVMLRTKPDLVFCHLVDEYVNATLCNLARNFGVRCVSYCASFFPNKVLITEYENGRPFPFREPGTAEIQEEVSRLSDLTEQVAYRNRPSFTLMPHLRNLARSYTKRAYFAFRKHIERDPLNMHYNITRYLGIGTSAFNLPKKTDFSLDWRGDLENELEQSNHAPVIFFPLAFVPESTTNYWVRNRAILDYEPIVLDLLTNLSKRFVVLVKEHPHMMGVRSLDFLRQLLALPSVISAHPTELSKPLLDASNITFIGAGSVGVEATIQGKPVISYCDTSYWFDASGATFADLNKISKIPDNALSMLKDHSPMSSQQKSDFLRFCLSSTGRMERHGKRWPLMVAEDLSALITHAIAKPVGSSGEHEYAAPN